jgi:16S rRNA (cytidine1402-2'-O)-methyltransferase
VAKPSNPRSANGNQPGTLYLVGTPIGNLEDISLRALRILKEVDLIACEDTRQTQKLLNHYGVDKRTISYHEHNELTRAAELIMHLQEGKSIGLVSDAGTPGVSDPGYRLVSLAIRHRLPVVPIPGPSAFLAALVASGLPTDSFRFGGFLPAKSGQRRAALESIKNSPRTEIFYEAPHRLLAALEDVVEALGAHRQVVIAREVTKLHEEFLRGPAGDLLAELKRRSEIRGEITLLIAKAEEHGQPAVQQKDTQARLRELMQEEGLDRRDAMKRVAKELGVSKSEVYRKLQQGRAEGGGPG